MTQPITTPFSVSERQLSDINVQPALRMVQHILSLDRSEIVAVCQDYCTLLHCLSIGERPKDIDPRVDALWHIHIIDMERYRSFCEKYFGHVVLHELPDQPITPDWLLCNRPALKDLNQKSESTSSPVREDAAMTAIAAGGQCKPIEDRSPKPESTSSPIREHAAMTAIAAGGQCKPIGV
jgi:hypothetical protein